MSTRRNSGRGSATISSGVGIQGISGGSNWIEAAGRERREWPDADLADSCDGGDQPALDFMDSISWTRFVRAPERAGDVDHDARSGCAAVHIDRDPRGTRLIPSLSGPGARLERCVGSTSTSSRGPNVPSRIKSRSFGSETTPQMGTTAIFGTSLRAAAVVNMLAPAQLVALFASSLRSSRGRRARRRDLQPAPNLPPDCSGGVAEAPGARRPRPSNRCGRHDGAGLTC